jgi:hypothetical protein
LGRRKNYEEQNRKANELGKRGGGRKNEGWSRKANE